jgi:hypothetical protein
VAPAPFSSPARPGGGAGVPLWGGLRGVQNGKNANGKSRASSRQFPVDASVRHGLAISVSLSFAQETLPPPEVQPPQEMQRQEAQRLQGSKQMQRLQEIQRLRDMQRQRQFQYDQQLQRQQQGPAPFSPLSPGEVGAAFPVACLLCSNIDIVPTLEPSMRSEGAGRPRLPCVPPTTLSESGPCASTPYSLFVHMPPCDAATHMTIRRRHGHGHLHPAVPTLGRIVADYGMAAL